MRNGRTLAAVGLGTAAAVAVGQYLGRVAGSTRAERRTALPGDDLVRHPTVATDHAVDIAAAPEDVWPWLTQMGWHRAGWYTPRWVDRLLFPANLPSADRLVGELLRDLTPGDEIPDGPPGTAHFVIVRADAPHLLVLRSTTHLPTAWRDRLGAGIDWTWTFVLTPRPDGSRLHLRVRGRTSPWWLTAAYVAALVPADYVMALGMLRGIERRVVSTRRTPTAEPVTTP